MIIWKLSLGIFTEVQYTKFYTKHLIFSFLLGACDLKMVLANMNNSLVSVLVNGSWCTCTHFL